MIFSCFSFVQAAAPKSAGQTIQDSPFFQETLKTGGIKEDITAGTEQENIARRVGRLIENVLQFIGLIILIFIIYAGILWLTAGGNTEKAQKARTILMNAFMGALIIGAAYAITAFILVVTQG